MILFLSIVNVYVSCFPPNCTQELLSEANFDVVARRYGSWVKERVWKQIHLIMHLRALRENPSEAREIPFSLVPSLLESNDVDWSLEWSGVEWIFSKKMNR